MPAAGAGGARRRGPRPPHGRRGLPGRGRCPARLPPGTVGQTAVAALAVAPAAARATSGWDLAAMTWMALLSVPLAAADIRERRLPNPLTGTAFAGVLILLAAAAASSGQPARLGRAAAGAFILVCFYLALGTAGMGPGDVKLAASTGLLLAWQGWPVLAAAQFAAFALAAAWGGFLLATRHEGSRGSMAFGPFALLGMLTAIVFLPPS